jgi:hypothetical protein
MNRVFAVVCGALAALAAAIIWAAITAATNFQIGYMAIGVGFAVAFAVRVFSHGNKMTAYISGVLSLAGCLLGNYLAAVAITAQHEHVAVVDASFRLLPVFFQVLGDTFSPMDIVFYALGVYFGYKYALAPAKPAAVEP